MEVEAGHPADTAVSQQLRCEFEMIQCLEFLRSLVLHSRLDTKTSKEIHDNDHHQLSLFSVYAWLKCIHHM
jgi:hypothetical protein